MHPHEPQAAENPKTELTGRRILGTLLRIAVLAAFFFIFFWVMFAAQSCGAWRAGERKLAAGNEVEAQAGFERSIRSHCPFNLWGARSAARLETMAGDYEKAGNLPRAVSAYESLLTSLAATNTGWSSARREKIAELEQKALALRRSLKNQGPP